MVSGVEAYADSMRLAQQSEHIVSYQTCSPDRVVLGQRAQARMGKPNKDS